MRAQRNLPTPRRVFVNIRETPRSSLSRVNSNRALKPSNVNPQPPPPASKPKFIRKQSDSLRCHTPDQGGGNPRSNKLPSLQFRQTPSRENSLNKIQNSPFFKPKDQENSSFLAQSYIDKEDSICMPYELKEKPRMQRRSPENVRESIVKRSIYQRVDLRKGSFSRKQISRDSAKTPNQVDISKMGLGNNVIQPWEEVGTNPTRTPSPAITTARNSKLNQLSKNFRLDKKTFENQVQNESRRTHSENPSAEKENKYRAYTPDPTKLHPWQNFLQALDSISKIQEVTAFEPTPQKRVPVKARHL